MKDWLLFTMLGVIIGALACFCVIRKDSYVEPIVIRVNRWHEALVDEPTPTYRPTPTSEPVPIPDTMHFADLPIESFRYDRAIPFSVNDSSWKMPISIYGEKQGWLKKLEVEAQQVSFIYEIKMKKQIDWRWTAVAFVLGACAMRGVDAALD